MKILSKAESIQLFEEYSKSNLSSISFSQNNTVFKFHPSKIGVLFMNILHLVLFFTPHYFYLFKHYSLNELTNNIVYVVVATSCIVFIIILSRLVPAYEIIINSTLKQIQLAPKDFFGKYLNKIVTLKIDDIVEIKEKRVKKKTGEDVFFILETKSGIFYTLFSITKWDNPTKTKAALNVLIYDKEFPYDDSKEPAAIVDNELQKLKDNIAKEGEGETSYLPMIVLISLLLVLIIGFILYFGLGKINSFHTQIDSLWLIKFKVWAIATAIFFIPIIFAANTKYQRKWNRTKKTIIVFGIMAMLGVFFCCYGLISYLNIKLDDSKPELKQAKLIDYYHTSGSKNSSGYFTIVLEIDSISDRISVDHRSSDFQMNLKSIIPVAIHKGYYNKRWLKVED